jgi:ankyrin repeat protein
MDAAYCSLNSRGRKFAKSTKRRSFGDLDEKYASVGLPAHKAAMLGDVEALKIIFFTIDNSPGVPLKDRYNSTPLHLAAKSNMHHALKWLLRYTDIDPMSSAKNGETPAHVAGAHGNTEIFKVLLSADAVDKDKLLMKCDNNGLSPLHICIIKQHMLCLKMLISEAPSRALGPVNESGITAGHVAASVGNVEILKMIHSRGKKYLHQVAADGQLHLLQ